MTAIHTAERLKETPMRVMRARWAIAAAYSLYLPAAGLYIHYVADDTKNFTVGYWSAYALILAIFVCCWMLSRTGIWRIAGEKDHAVDDVERSVRERVYTRAYRLFTAATVLLGVYMMLAIGLHDKHGYGFYPTESDHWWILAGGIVLFSLTLPSAFLAWMLPTHDPGED